eukprot:8350262-Pyramimonas_sp.AAC.1
MLQTAIAASQHKFERCADKWRCSVCLIIVDSCHVFPAAATECVPPCPLPEFAACGEVLWARGPRVISGKAMHPSHTLATIP